MLAMILEAPKRELVPVEMPKPRPAAKEVLIRVEACALCRTDLHIVDGDLKPPAYPVVLGHEIVGIVEECGGEVTRFKVGDRVGVPWLGKACGKCEFCKSGRENLCNAPEFTGLSRQGGFAHYVAAHEDFIFSIPDSYGPLEAAPLLCAGLIGYRSYTFVKDRHRLGIYGFGAAAHIITQVAVYKGHEVYGFTRPGDAKKQAFALELGCAWSGDSTELPPKALDAAIIFAPIGGLVPLALNALKKGGVCVCAGIHMTEIPSFPYSILWGERVLRSVANLTRQDGEEFFDVAPKVPIRPTITIFDLQEVNEAIRAMRHGEIKGAAVIRIG